jgi:hypothetical protein
VFLRLATMGTGGVVADAAGGAIRVVRLGPAVGAGAIGVRAVVVPVPVLGEGDSRKTTGEAGEERISSNRSSLSTSSTDQPPPLPVPRAVPLVPLPLSSA